MSDFQNPTITGGPPATTTDPNQTWSFSFIDQGLGSLQYLIDEPGNPNWDQTKVKSLGCYAVSWWPCPTGWQTVSAQMGNLTPGTHTIRLQVWDGGNKFTQAFRTVTVNYPYPTSVRYGGPNYAVDTDAERAALDDAVENTGTDENALKSLLDGLRPADLTNYNAWFDAQLDIEPIATATDLFDEGRSCITRLWRKRKIVQSPILVTVWRWKARSDCGLLPVLQTGSSELSWTGGWKVGSTCLALPGGDCVSRGRRTRPGSHGSIAITMDTIKTAMNDSMRWRAEPDDHPGFDEKACTGYGSPVLDCTFWQFITY
jgi:hypothetical protein